MSNDRYPCANFTLWSTSIEGLVVGEAAFLVSDDRQGHANPTAKAYLSYHLRR